MPDLLTGIAANPVPESATAGRFEGHDGTVIRYCLFKPDIQPARGTVIVLHGRNECIEKYFETASDLMRRGLAVATFDWRGQGGSARLTRNPHQGHVESFSDYVADLEVFFDNVVLPDCQGPYFVLGHSTGSLIALIAAPGMTNRVERMVLSAPLLELQGQRLPDWTIALAASVFSNIGLGRIHLVGGRPEMKPFEKNKLTTDPHRYARNAELFHAAPELFLGGPTATWVDAFYRASTRVRDPEFAAEIRIPVLMVAAGADEVVSNRAIEEYAYRLRAGSLVTIAGSRHEILQEADLYREQFLAAFDAFVPGAD